jgi:trans-aconitate 2-methyltransferase
LQFEVMDARSLNINNRFDLVFSNAAMHWVDDHSAFLRGVAKHLCIGGRLVLSCGGADNASGIIAALEMVTSSSAWQRYFEGFHFPYHFYSPNDYSAWLPEANLTAVWCELVEKDMIHDGPEGLAGWIRTTWLPYTQRLPERLLDRFINDIVSQYLDNSPPDESGHTHVQSANSFSRCTG